MAHFFFHLVSKDKMIRDPNGREFEDLSAAHQHAQTLVEKSILLLSHELNWTGWSINVSNENDDTVLTVLFPPAVASTKRPAKHQQVHTYLGGLEGNVSLLKPSSS